MTADVRLASICLPFVFSAVEIARHAYRDGGYADNPALEPLLEPTRPEVLLLERAQPAPSGRVKNVPRNRQLVERDRTPQRARERAPLPESVELVSYGVDDTLLDPPNSSKFNGEGEFLSLLFRSDRLSAEQRASAMRQRSAKSASRRGGMVVCSIVVCDPRGRVPAPHGCTARRG